MIGVSVVPCFKRRKKSCSEFSVQETGDTVGVFDGTRDGLAEGSMVSSIVGLELGCTDGIIVAVEGAKEGLVDGSTVLSIVGLELGCPDISIVGSGDIAGEG